jgi:hypothetical protein
VRLRSDSAEVHIEYCPNPNYVGADRFASRRFRPSSERDGAEVPPRVRGGASSGFGPCRIRTPRLYRRARHSVSLSFPGPRDLAGRGRAAPCRSINSGALSDRSEWARASYIMI